MSDLERPGRHDGLRRAVGRASLMLVLLAPALVLLNLVLVLVLASLGDGAVKLDRPPIDVFYAVALVAMIAGAILAIVSVARGGAGRAPGVAALWALGVIIVVGGGPLLFGLIASEPF
jgi:hypothetical protein